MTSLLPADPLAPVLSAFLASNSKRTQAAYAHDLSLFARWLGVESVSDAARKLLASNGVANLTAHEWKTRMLADGLAAATINRRLSSLRALVKLAQVSGIVSWTLYAPSVKPEPRRDVAGPTWETFGKIVEAEPSARVRAMLCLLGFSGLRISEVLGITLADVAPDHGTVFVTRKGHRERTPVPVEGENATALRTWLEERGRAVGPIFDIGYAHAYTLVKAAGERVGVRISPHRLRHSPVTRALDVEHGGLRRVQRFSSHASVEMLRRYDDARGEDVARSVARKVAGVE